MSKSPFEVGHTVIICDKANFYHGQEGVITARSLIGEMNSYIFIYTVAVGNVTFTTRGSGIRHPVYEATQ